MCPLGSAVSCFIYKSRNHRLLANIKISNFPQLILEDPMRIPLIYSFFYHEQV